jgi:RNA polymerase sigma-70 factor (ECF subfamily)
MGAVQEHARTGASGGAVGRGTRRAPRRRGPLGGRSARPPPLRAFRKASRYQASLGRFTAWLATVARHDALNHLRRRRAATVSLDETLLAAGTTSEAGTEITIALMEAIGRLKEPGQTIARLRLLEGKSFAQIGRATNHPTETVKTIYYRNIEKLRKAIR